MLIQRKLLMDTEHQINIEANCSPGLTSARRPAFITFGSLQRRSNVFISLLFSNHWLIGLVFELIHRRDLLHIRTLHVVHVFGVGNDIREAKPDLRQTTTLVLDLVELLPLLWHSHLSLRLFLLLLFLRLFELIVRSEQIDLPPFALLRHGLWALLQQVNSFPFVFWIRKLS